MIIRLVKVFIFVMFSAIFVLTFVEEGYAKTREHKKLEQCLDDFFAPKVPLGKYELYRAWVSDIQNSKESFKFCEQSVNAFLENPGYDINPAYVNEHMWIKAMGILKMGFKPNQRDGKKNMLSGSRGAPIGEWWAIKK